MDNCFQKILFVSANFCAVQVECREFRESILGVMPHRWICFLDSCAHCCQRFSYFHVYSGCMNFVLYTIQERREDTKLTLAHFRKHKRKIHKKLPGSKSSSGIHKSDGVQKPGKDVGNKLANIIGKAADLASNTKPMKVISSRN